MTIAVNLTTSGREASKNELPVIWLEKDEVNDGPTASPTSSRSSGKAACKNRSTNKRIGTILNR